jgi:hypothetical protein
MKAVRNIHITFILLFLICNLNLSLENKKFKYNNIRSLQTSISMNFQTAFTYASGQMAFGRLSLLADNKTVVGVSAQDVLILGLLGKKYLIVAADSSAASFTGTTASIASNSMQSHASLSSIHHLHAGNNYIMTFQNVSLSSDKNTMAVFYFNGFVFSLFTSKTNYFSSLASGYSALVTDSKVLDSSNVCVMQITYKEYIL